MALFAITVYRGPRARRTILRSRARRGRNDEYDVRDDERMTDVRRRDDDFGEEYDEDFDRTTNTSRLRGNDTRRRDADGELC